MSPQYPPNPNIKDIPDEPALEYAIKGTTAKVATLTAENVELRQRLGEAEGLLTIDKSIFEEMDRLHPELRCYCHICTSSRGIEPCDMVTQQIKGISDFLTTTLPTSAPEPMKSYQDYPMENYTKNLSNNIQPVYGQCPKCGGNLATCISQGCPNNAPEPWFEELKHEVNTFIETATKEKLMASMERVSPEPGDMVMVPKMEFSLLMMWTSKAYTGNPHYDRLKAALAAAGKGDDHAE